jgi:hypothetical protein
MSSNLCLTGESGSTAGGFSALSMICFAVRLPSPYVAFPRRILGGCEEAGRANLVDAGDSGGGRPWPPLGFEPGAAAAVGNTVMCGSYASSEPADAIQSAAREEVCNGAS